MVLKKLTMILLVLLGGCGDSQQGGQIVQDLRGLVLEGEPVGDAVVIETPMLKDLIRQDAGKFDYQTITLKNGLQVVTLEDFSTPIAAVQVWYHVGSKNENPARQGFAHMFEHMMFRGTDKLGSTDHFSLIRRVGGTTNGYTSFDRTVYLETLPSDQLELALWLEAERMTFLKIDEQAFNTERNVVEEELRNKQNNPYGTLYEDVFAAVFKEYPYRWTPIGKLSHLEAATVAELRDFYNTYYVPNNAVLIIVGAVEHTKAQELADKYFGWIPGSPEPPRVEIKEPQLKETRYVTIEQKNAPAPGVGVIYRSIPVGDKDQAALDLAAVILGGGKSSRIYRELVAEKQLAVAAEAEHWSLEKDGLFGAGALLMPIGGDPNKVVELIDEQIEKLRSEPVSKRELLKAKNQMLRDIVTGNLRIESKAGMLGMAAVEVGDLSYVNRMLDEIKAVSAEDILRVCNEYLQPQHAIHINVKQKIKLPGLSGEKDKGNSEDVEGIVLQDKKVLRPEAKRPEYYPSSPPLKDIAVKSITPKSVSRILDNGLKVIIIPNHEVGFVTARLGLMSGGWTEDKPGTCAMAMSMLTKGTVNFSEGQLADELETYAISLNGSGDMDTATVNMGCLSEYFEKGLRLTGEVALSPVFPQEEFEKLRRQVLTGLAVSAQEPEYLVEKEYRKRLYGDHPYSRTATGEPEDIEALDVNDLKQWWGKFAKSDDAVLIVAGDVEADDVFELVGDVFGKWINERPLADAVNLPEIKPVEGRNIYLVDRPGSIQSQVRIGHLGMTRRQQPEYFESRVVSNYFGWGFDSRLNRNVRVEKGLTYGVWGSFIANHFAGEFTVGTFSKTESTADAIEAVIDEIEQFKTVPPDANELSQSKSYLLGSFVLHRETPQQIAEDFWLIESQGLGNDYLERLLKSIETMDKDDCVELTGDFVNPDRLVIAIVGDGNDIAGDLEKIAPVTLVNGQKKDENAEIDMPSPN
ncbi:MAG: pitrilysin family protein [Phycisphaerae bacterium]|nr:pitrilysin family protein [Phycisphaerae bacterium]